MSPFFFFRDIKNVIERVKVHFNNREFSESVNLCKKILTNKDYMPEALYFLGLSLQAQNKHQLALNSFMQYFDEFGDNAYVYNATANTYLLLKDYKNAEKYCQLALKLVPEYGAAFNNLAICKQQVRKYKEAEGYYRKSILYQGNEILFHINLGKLYKELGQFELSNKTLVKAMELDGDKSSIYTIMYENFMYMHKYQDALEVADLGLMNKDLADIYLIDLLVGKAILFWLFDNIEEAIQAINLSEIIHSFPDGSYENLDSLKVFHTYIKKLIVFYQNNTSLYEERKNDIYFISESHCFSANNMQVEYNNSLCSIRPIFIKGAKAFHLSQQQSNQFKVSVLTALNGLPSNSNIVIGFGEIDCRYNEGILKHCLSKGLYSNNIITSMIQNYIGFLKLESDSRSLNILIYGVPSPHPEQLASLPLAQQAQLKDIIKDFNYVLKSECQKYNLVFLDVYKLTNNDGESNLQYHFDNIHMVPSVLPLLFKQIKVN